MLNPTTSPTEQATAPARCPSIGYGGLSCDIPLADHYKNDKGEVVHGHVLSVDDRGFCDDAATWTDESSSTTGRALTVIDGGKEEALRPVPLDTLRAIDVTQMDGEHLAMFIEMVRDARREATSSYDEVIRAAEAALTQKIKDVGGRAIPSFEFDAIAIEDVYTPYAFDDGKLVEAQKILKPDEAAKIRRFVPHEVIPAHYTPGSPVSISALIRKYGESSPVGQILSAAMTRTKVGEKLVIKRAKGSPGQTVIEGGSF